MKKAFYLRVLPALALSALFAAGCGSDLDPKGVTIIEPEPAPVSATVGNQYNAEILSVDMTPTAAEEVFPTVTFQVRDAQGRPVSGLTDNFEFTLAKRDGAWQSYINQSRLRSANATSPNPVRVLRATGERAGVNTTGRNAVEDLGNGRYRYTFVTDLSTVNDFKYYGAPTAPVTGAVSGEGVLDSPAATTALAALDVTYDPALLHRITVSARPSAVNGQIPYRFNAVADFRPNQLPAFDSGTRLDRDRSVATACNSCHAPTSLSASGQPAISLANVHTNYRYDTALCVTCHNVNTFDSRQSTDTEWVHIGMRRMIHTLHAGTSGGSTQDYLGGAAAADPYILDGRNYTGLRYPQSMANCNACHPGVAGPGSDGYRSNYTQTEHATSADLQAYYTPNYSGRILSVTIPQEGAKSPTVTFEVLDAEGNPVTDLGNVQFEYMFAKLIPGDGRHQDYWQSYRNVLRTGTGTTDGVLRADRPQAVPTNADRASEGIYTYTFALDFADPAANNPTAANFNNNPEAVRVLDSLDLDFDPNAVHRIAIAVRPTAEARGLRGNALPYRYNVVADFIPAQLNAGGSNLWSDWELERQIVTNQSCGTCHDMPIFLDKRNNSNARNVHTNYRYDVNLCATCHNQNTFDRAQSRDDEWVTLDLATLIHNIHANRADYRADAKDYSFVAGNYASTRYPLAITDCRACHDNPLAEDGRSAVERDSWKNNPSIEACGSCHTDFQPQAHFTSFSCATCHTPANVVEKHR